MSKKKDFKGVTSGIVTNRVTSIDDFLSNSDEQPADTQPPKEPKPARKPENPRSKQLTSTPETQPAPAQEPEKIRISLFMASRASFELDELKMKIRRQAPRSAMSRISKSSIVEAAVDIVKKDFEANGMESILVRSILK
jgi:hypothetical protein